MEGIKKKIRSQDLEPPGRLVFVVQTVCSVEVELPGGGRLLLVIQAVRRIEGQASATVCLVMMVVVMS